jgi:hypothetical protein
MALKRKGINNKTMNINISTPMYGGNCSGPFLISLLSLIKNLEKRGHQVSFTALYNESLITRARNSLTNSFLLGNADKLVFIDGDESFDTEGTIRMILEDVDIIGAPVPLKYINWDRAAEAAKNGQDPRNHTGKYNINFLTVEDRVKIQNGYMEKIPVRHIGTGLMAVKREVFEKMKPVTEKYILGNEVNGVGDAKSYVYNFWSVEVDPESETLLSEDYYFCKKWSSLGGEVYLAPYVKTSHFGTYEFK